MCRRSPMFFRQNLVVDGPNGPGKFGNFMSPVQIADFTAIDPALMFFSGQVKTPPTTQRFWLQRSRGYSKTTDRAADILYALLFCPRKLDAVVAAEDRDQALLIREQLLKICQYNDWMYDFIDVQKSRIKNKQTDATLNSLSRDTMSSFGLTPEFVIADEFTHWTQQDLWSSVFSSFNKTAHRGGILVVACNAGWGNDWKWKVRELARRSEKWYFNAPYGWAPWYRKEDIDEQREGLTPSEFGRLWLNDWQASSGEYVSLTEADACISKDVQRINGTPVDGRYYVAAVDYAAKEDRTVGVVTELFDGEIRVVRMDVVDPATMPNGIVPISWVEDWMLKVNAAFGGNSGHVTFVIDDYQLLYVKQRLENDLDIESFEFRSGKGNFELAVILRELIIQKRIKWYDGCGAIYTQDGRQFREEEGRDDVCTELAKLVKKQIGSSRWRFDHVKGEHDDRAFALGAAARHIVMNSGGMDEWFVSRPFNNGSFGL